MRATLNRPVLFAIFVAVLALLVPAPLLANSTVHTGTVCQSAMAEEGPVVPPCCVSPYSIPHPAAVSEFPATNRLTVSREVSIQSAEDQTLGTSLEVGAPPVLDTGQGDLLTAGVRLSRDSLSSEEPPLI